MGRTFTKTDWPAIIQAAKNAPDKWVKVGPLDPAAGSRLRHGHFKGVDPEKIEVVTARVVATRRPSWIYVRWVGDCDRGSDCSEEAS